MSGFIQGEDRFQATLFPERLDDYVAEDHQGRKVFTLQTLPDNGSDDLILTTVGEVSGFSVHAGVATKANERAKLERLCRYITRPAVSTKRLSLTRNGRVRYELNQK